MHKPLTLTTALAPLVLLVSLLALSVLLFGADSSYGANQVALLFSAAFTGLVGLHRGLSWRDIEQGIQDAISMCVAPLLILMAVGMLIGAWILAGTIPALIYYGVEILNPTYFYAASALICAIIATSIGSSWTVAGTMGIGLMAIAGSFGLSPAIAAGAIISGAYFGDKLSPLSDTTNLAAAVTGVDLFSHIRHMLWTTVPSFAIALIIFSLIGGEAATPPSEIAELRQNMTEQFNLGLHLLLPLLIMLGLAWRRVAALPAILISTLMGVSFALLFQPQAVMALAGDAHGLSTPLLKLKGVWISLFSGFTSSSSSPFLDQLLSKGGMASMLNTVSLIICAMAMGGTLQRVGILEYLVNAALKRAHSKGALIATTVATCTTTNLMTADQFIAISIPGTMYRAEFDRRGISRLDLSRTLEDSATLTSALVPWNTCGAYMAATLGVATLSYAPFAFFNYLCPLIAIIYGYAGIGQKLADTAGPQGSRA
ncbi:Na+/H+ antiporter NhaC [Halieaceae bacterium IMCC14734]|uniref:Na+/H+ antiporter NhaC n=1 Tax=Candidatus Litorirhabdus singularis TaxID=2518993 RepID=A0ABT3TBZ9_9GAMM|nr:Na+/H+ antiporter NhaC [Candidatus Litorirhabdus singularis]MCX2979813.1 Na+/H+ antiporter NhaC [Candidatus Litorirhabdus singularis]